MHFQQWFESQMCDINTFEEDNGRLIIEGELYEEVNEYIIRNLQTVELVLKDSTGDKYVYTTDYYLSTEGIEFSSIQEDEEESNIILSEIDKGNYYVLLRVRYENSNNEDGYVYRYYTFKNNTENNNVEMEGMNIYFDIIDDSFSYLTIEK